MSTDNQTETPNKTQPQIKVTFSWLPFWVAGYMFCLGYIGFPPAFFEYSFWEQCVTVILSFVLWPLLLGLQLSGRATIL